MRARRRQPPQAATAVETAVETMTMLTLPAPPSANNLFVTVGRRRVRSRRYRAWQTEAGWHLQAQRVGTIGGPWQCHITLPATVRADADNLIKPILDLLVRHAVVDDDRHCRKVTVEKGGDADAVVVALSRAMFTADKTGPIMPGTWGSATSVKPAE